MLIFILHNLVSHEHGLCIISNMVYIFSYNFDYLYCSPDLIKTNLSVRQMEVTSLAELIELNGAQGIKNNKQADI